MTIHLNPKHWYLALLLLCASLAFICMNAGCRTVKRDKSSTRTKVDSVSHLSTLGTKQTTIKETINKDFLFNPGDFSGYFNPHDTSAQIFETDGYIIAIKPGEKKGSLSVSGKDKKIGIPGDKETNIYETEATDLKTREKSSSETKQESKDVTSVPMWAIAIGALLAGCLLVFLINYRRN